MSRRTKTYRPKKIRWNEGNYCYYILRVIQDDEETLYNKYHQMLVVFDDTEISSSSCFVF